jgi:hypothetical protein
MTTEIFNKPLFSLTVGEFLSLQETKIPINEKQHDCKTETKQYVYGIAGLAKLLNCSLPTAQKLKNSGRLSYSQAGRKIVFEVEKVLSEISKK